MDGFTQRRTTTDTIFALRILRGEYREGQRELHCVSVDLERAFDGLPREELWACTRESGVAEMYVQEIWWRKGEVWGSIQRKRLVRERTRRCIIK